jgi:hypothetical protein
MKHDPGMHIGLRLAFFGKSGVTVEDDVDVVDVDVDEVGVEEAVTSGREYAS